MDSNLLHTDIMSTLQFDKEETHLLCALNMKYSVLKKQYSNKGCSGAAEEETFSSKS